MKSNELRIENCLQLTATSRQELWDCCEVHTESDVVSVDWINKDEIGVWIDGDSFEFEFDGIQPIPLTEEWLIKSKAKKVANTYHLDRFLFIWKPEYEYWYVVDLDSLAYLTKIEFVHELQNFYFVMQGKELEIVA